jgi:hypothetical protein
VSEQNTAPRRERSESFESAYSESSGISPINEPNQVPLEQRVINEISATWVRGQENGACQILARASKYCMFLDRSDISELPLECEHPFNSPWGFVRVDILRDKLGESVEIY